jgi:hypothetical protein
MGERLFAGKKSVWQKRGGDRGAVLFANSSISSKENHDLKSK